MNVSEKSSPAVADLFGEAPATAQQLREEARFGTWDARTGFSMDNHYSQRIKGARLEAYRRAFMAERQKGLAADGSLD